MLHVVVFQHIYEAALDVLEGYTCEHIHYIQLCNLRSWILIPLMQPYPYLNGFEYPYLGGKIEVRHGEDFPHIFAFIVIYICNSTLQEF